MNKEIKYKLNYNFVYKEITTPISFSSGKGYSSISVDLSDVFDTHIVVGSYVQCSAIDENMITVNHVGSDKIHITYYSKSANTKDVIIRILFMKK